MDQDGRGTDSAGRFDPLVDSSELIGNPGSLRQRFETDGYLFLKGLLPEDRLRNLQGEIFRVCRAGGWFDPDSESIERGEPRIIPVNEGEEEYLKVYDEVQRLESFHSLAHDSAILEVMRALLDETAFPHPLSVCRLMFPRNNDAITPPHQDYPNNQGTPELYTCWIPLTDCPMELGGLAVLPGSHRHGVFPVEFALGPGRRQVVLPEELQGRRSRAGDMRIGDVLIFHSLLVHEALPNLTSRMRLSVDYRYQSAREPLTEGCLKPHFQRLTWDEIYETWQSDRYQYYWEPLSLELAPWSTKYAELPDDHLAQALKQEREYNRKRFGTP